MRALTLFFAVTGCATDPEEFEAEGVASEKATPGALCDLQAACPLPSAKPGDADGDGDLDEDDVRFLDYYVRYGATSDAWIRICGASADVDGDGRLTRSDVKRLWQYINSSKLGMPALDLVPYECLWVDDVTDGSAE